MVQDDGYCIDVLIRISAVRAASGRVALGLLDDHPQHGVMGAGGVDKAEKADEVMAAVARPMRRGWASARRRG
jgi:DNA-binding FrmR family transcriptional regulator